MESAMCDDRWTAILLLRNSEYLPINRLCKQYCVSVLLMLTRPEHCVAKGIYS
jgi:hypothetical protein